MATAKMFTNAMKGFMMGAYTWKTSGGSSFKVALLANTWTPDQDLNVYFGDISTNECPATGSYVRIGTGVGKDIVLVDPTIDTASNETRMASSAAFVEWNPSTITARYAAIVRWNTTAANSELIGYIDFGSDQISSNGSFKITWDATGIFKVTAA